MNRKAFLTIALLCAIVLGAWADTWDGKTYTQPKLYTQINTYEKAIDITNAAELAWISQHFNEKVSFNSGYEINLSEATFFLSKNIDMGDTSWTPLGNASGSITDFTGIFDGSGHTIRINISGATDNYQGLFGRIGEGGRVLNLRVSGSIQCSRSRLVGGIAGENLGTIENCWVSADVSSDWHESGSAYTGKVGGITGENQGTIHYCCVSGNVHNDDADVGGLVGYHNKGNVSHCTFYGVRNSTHSQDNECIGDQDGSVEDLHTSFTDDELTSHLASFSDFDFYRRAVQRPYAISITDEGPNAIEPSATASRSGQTITLAIKQTPGIKLRDVTVKDADGNAISVTGNTKDGYTFTMPKRDVNIKVSYTFGGGYGTKAEPYLIKTAEHWDQLAVDVASGNEYDEAYFQLESDISVTTMMGTSGHSFGGYFDGNGKTLTVNYTTSEEYCAPFRYAESPKISNLHVAGTITTSAKFAAGIVACFKGYHPITIINCRSSVTISSSVNGDGTHGGLVALNNNCTLNIEGCIFDGQMLGENTNSCGGFVGYNTSEFLGSGAVEFSQCLFAPTAMEWTETANFARGWPNNIYTSSSYCFTYNKDIYTITDDGSVTVASDCDAPKTYSVSGLEFYSPGLKYQGVLCAKSDDAVNLKLTHTGTAPEGKALTGYSASEGTLMAKVANGEYVLTMPGSNVTISAVYGDPSMLWSGEGTGEASTPYVIDTPARWDEFAGKVNAGIGNERFAIAYYKLGADIAVSTMVGTADHKFRGHFDGNGKTLTLSYGTSANPFSEDYCAPFRYVDGADIHDVIAAGTIYTANKFAAGLVGYSVGNTTIADSRVSVILNSSVDGDGTHGGIAANIQGGKAAITRCAFNGQLLGAKTDCWGGLVGWTKDEVDCSNCLFAPANVTIITDESRTFGRYSSHFNLQCYNCCYTTMLGDSQNGKLVYAARLADTPCKEYEVAGVKYYSEETIVSDVAATDIFPNSATISWKSTAEEYTYQLRYRKSKAIYFTNFADVEWERWTYIDATKSNIWLVSPQLSLADELSVWVSSYMSDDEDTGEVQFAIYLSKTGKFVGDDGEPVDGLVTLLPETEPTSEYTKYTVDLSPYKGKQAYIGIRRINCTFSNGIVLTDFGIYDKNVDDTETVVDASINGVTLTGLDPLTAYEYEVAYTVDNTTYYTSTERLTTLSNDIILADDADNSTTISDANGCLANVTLSDRTLYKDGAWNTIVLPFRLALEGSPLAGAVAQPLTSASISGTTLYLNFGNPVTTLEAGTPYIIKWDSGDDIVNPVFNGVTINATTRDYDNGVSGDDRVRFLGTYKSTAFDAEDKSILLMGGANTLYYPTEVAGIGACRAYFKIGDGTALARQLTAFNIDFGNGEEAQGVTAPLANQPGDGVDAWYTLDGRRLAGKPSRAGVYINNGVKRVIK